MIRVPSPVGDSVTEASGEQAGGTLRAGWAEAAAEIGAMPLTDEEEEWLAFGNAVDDSLTW